jgi:transglutaminase-like putative cysteine protease
LERRDIHAIQTAAYFSSVTDALGTEYFTEVFAGVIGTEQSSVWNPRLHAFIIANGGGCAYGQIRWPSPEEPFRSEAAHGPLAKKNDMELRVGHEVQYDFSQPTPVILMLNVHFSRVSDLAMPDHITLSPSVAVSGYRDGFGNWCSRFVAPAGRLHISADFVVRDSGLPDPVVADARQIPVEELPEEAIVYLLASRFCDSDQMLDLAWELFGKTEPGWPRVQAVCDFVHQHITFGYEDAKVTRSASEAYQERVGVCRDYTHLAVALCRALNIPARYCAGYLSYVGTPKPYPPGDFAAWFEAYLGGEWHTFDPRNNEPRIGRVLLAQGRDAADVPMTMTFGPHTPQSFRVWADEIVGSD